MPIPPRDREPAPPPEGAVQPPREDLTQPGPPAEEAEPGPDAVPGTAAPEDEYAAALREVEDRWRRALADLDNLRKRHARELEREAAAERARTAAAFLPVIDNLELALNHAAADPGAIVEGVRAVRDQAVNVLERLGYPRHGRGACRSTRPGTRWSAWSRIPMLIRTPWSRCCDPVTGRPSGSCGLPP